MATPTEPRPPWPKRAACTPDERQRPVRPPPGGSGAERRVIPFPASSPADTPSESDAPVAPPEPAESATASSTADGAHADTTRLPTFPAPTAPLPEGTATSGALALDAAPVEPDDEPDPQPARPPRARPSRQTGLPAFLGIFLFMIILAGGPLAVLVVNPLMLYFEGRPAGPKIDVQDRTPAS